MKPLDVFLPTPATLNLCSFALSVQYFYVLLEVFI